MATQADIDRLEAAMARGELKVRHSDGAEITYRSVSDMIAAAAYLRNQITGGDFNRTTLPDYVRS